MKNYLNLKVFTDEELNLIVNASSLLSNLLGTSQDFDSQLDMYEQFDEWRTIVNIQCSAYNELKARRRSRLQRDELNDSLCRWGDI